MAESKNSRKKAMAIFVLVFLACGGGIFLFLVFQGLGEFKPGDKGNFHYGFSPKNALMPLLSYFSPSDSEAALVKKAKNRMESRGLDLSLLEGSKADVSDWMAKGGSASGSAPSQGGRGAASSSRTSVPSMGGGLGGLGGGGGGGSQTSGVSGFGGGSGAGNTKVTAGGGLGITGPLGTNKGTLGSLAGTRAMMKEGIRSGSAMTAKSKWDQGFGAAAGGKAAGGQLAYGKQGLVSLDGIKKGDIADLKTIDPNHLSSDVPSPVEDKTAVDPLAQKIKGKDGGDEAKAAAEQATQNALQGAAGAGSGGGGTPKSATPGGSAPIMPDPDAIKAAVDQFCPQGCDPGDGTNYKDQKITYDCTTPKSCTATYEGTHDGTPYKDKVDLKVGEGGNVEMNPISSCIQQSGGGWAAADFGTTNLSTGDSAASCN